MSLSIEPNDGPSLPGYPLENVTTDGTTTASSFYTTFKDVLNNPNPTLSFLQTSPSTYEVRPSSQSKTDSAVTQSTDDTHPQENPTSFSSKHQGTSPDSTFMPDSPILPDIILGSHFSQFYVSLENTLVTVLANKPFHSHSTYQFKAQFSSEFSMDIHVQKNKNEQLNIQLFVPQAWHAILHSHLPALIQHLRKKKLDVASITFLDDTSSSDTAIQPNVGFGPK